MAEAKVVDTKPTVEPLDSGDNYAVSCWSCGDYSAR